MAIGKQFFDFIEDRQKDVANAISSGVKAVDGFIDDNIPGGKEYTDNWASGVQKIGDHINDISTGFKQIADEPIDSVDDVAPFLVGSFLKGSEDFTKGAENITSNLGIDSRAGTLLGAFAEEVALLGLGQIPKKISKLPPATPMPQAQLVAAEAGKVKAKQLGALPEQVFGLSVDEAPKGYARVRGQRGRNRVVTSSDRKVEGLIADNVSTDELTNRSKKTALATNYELSDQDLFQSRYGKSRDVASQAHHALDQDLFGRAFDGADVREIANKHMLRFGNDAFNMADVPGYIAGSDHQGYFHGKIYRQLPARKELDSAIKDGSYYRYSPKYRSKLVIAAAKESQQSVIRWAKWKLNLMEEKYPVMKKMNSKQKRMWIEQFKEEFQSIGAGQQPSMEELMKGRPQYLNDDLREVFGIQFGSKPTDKSHPIPGKYRRRPDGSIASY